MLPGCAKRNDPNVVVAGHGAAVGVPMKEAKYSTLGDNTKIPLGDIEPHYNLRNGLKEALAPARSEIMDILSAAEGRKVDQATLDRLHKTLETTETALTKAADDKMMTNGKEKLVQLIGNLEALRKTTLEDFASGTDSVGYSRAVRAQEGTGDLNDALERDLHIMKQGKFAVEIIKLDNVLELFNDSAAPIETADTAWFTAHKNELDTFRARADEALKLVTAAEGNEAFASIREDLSDVKHRSRSS